MTEKKFQIPGAPTVLIKGGTSTANYDREMAKKAASAEARRQHQDRQERAAMNASGNEVARLGSQKFITSESPRLVLRYLNKDKTIRQECIAEITHIPGATAGELDSMFSLVCPKCLERGLPQGEAQLMVRNSHRKFHLDTSKAGVDIVEYGMSRQAVLICGKVTCEDTIRCSNYNCTWAVRIGDSNVVEV